MTDLSFPVSTLSKPYWTAAAEGRLVLPWCEACSKYFFAPEVACPGCLSTAWSWREASGRAELYSYTTVHRAPFPGMAVPYVLGAFDLEEGVSMFAYLVDADPDAVACGLKVEVAFQPLHDGRIAPVFKPA